MDAETINLEIELLIQAIFSKFHYDFRHYSRSSLRRRLEQAMLKFNLKNISEIQVKILHEQDFFPKLLAYLTVNTTEMFRDPGYFKSIKERVFPFLKTFPSIKIWIAGCSTGEEVVSFAILLKESGFEKFLIYATDINPMNLEVAQKGIYPIDSISKASKNYQLAGGSGSLSDYFDTAYSSVRFNEDLLKNVVFSDHSLSTDSVFSETHLISCRNVLIYFDRPLQDRALKLFRESLIRGTFLGLGNKESIQFSEVKDSFEIVDKENRIYRKKEIHA
ncbi:MAG: CheR family methyltransferase [Bacteriovoracia bacterium]